jgi:myxalamid-type polyketide synthase MxaE and MxaD
VLQAPGAGHSPQVEVVKEQLRGALEGIEPQPTTVPLYSTVLGGVADGRTLDATYWGRNVRDPVRFSDAVEALCKAGHDLFLEFSPHPILAPALTQCLEHFGQEGTVLPSLRRKRGDQATILGSLGKLYTQGLAVNWNRLYVSGRACVRLPSYPWQRERFWFADSEARGEGRRALPSRRNGKSGHPLLGPHLQSAAHPGAHFWEMELGAGALTHFGGYQVLGTALLPATFYLELALAAAREAFGSGPHALEDIKLHRHLPFSDGRVASQQMQLVISNGAPGLASFQLYSRKTGALEPRALWTLHADGNIRLADGGPQAA